MYYTRCPKCGNEMMRLLSCKVRFDKGPILEEDGFYLGDGKGAHTEGEVFKCSGCHEQFEISKLVYAGDTTDDELLAWVEEVMKGGTEEEIYYVLTDIRRVLRDRLNKEES